MFFFIIFLAATSAVFAALLETQNWLSQNRPLSSQIFKQIIPSLLGPIYFSVVYLHNHFGLLQLLAGLLFVFISFVHLGILNLKKDFNYYFTIHFILICTISALSGLGWQEALWGPISFLLLLPVIFFFSKKLANLSGKIRENVKELLELTMVINSIFIFVIGLVVASDRVRFLEKIVNWIFN